MKLYAFLIFCILFSFFCCHNFEQKGKSKTAESENNKTLIDTPMNYLEWEKQRIKNLMEDFKKPLEEIETQPTSIEVNALFGVGYQVKNEQVACIIYIYQTQSEHKAAQVLLKKQSKPEIKNMIIASNGRLFFWGYRKTNNPMAEYTLNDLAAAFSGEE